MQTKTKLDDFTHGYITAALWCSTDDAGNPLDSNYYIDDLAPETLARMVADCERFQRENAQLLEAATCRRGSEECSESEQAGHDFWLTRCGHGAGFWDGDWFWHEETPEETQAMGDIGDLLTQAAKGFGNVDLYIGDDGLIYAS